MHNNEEILKEGSKAFKLLERLKKHASVCFKEDDFKYEAVMSNISSLESLFKPYALEFDHIQEGKKQDELKKKQICASEGHIGEWVEDIYNENIFIEGQMIEHPFTRWLRTCTRCGEKEEATKEPEEVRKLRKRKEIEKMEEKLKKMKSEL